VDLNVVRSLDEVGSGDGSIGNKSGISTIPISKDDRGKGVDAMRKVIK
jgi:hypothetical protein